MTELMSEYRKLQEWGNSVIANAPYDFEKVASVLTFNMERSEQAVRQERPFFHFRTVTYSAEPLSDTRTIFCWRAWG